MKQFLLKCLGVGSLLSLLVATPASAMYQKNDLKMKEALKAEAVPGEYVVKVKRSDLSSAQFQAALSSFGLRTGETLSYLP